jgi:predicted esterase
LSWTIPDPNRPGDTVTCEVFFGTQPDRRAVGYDMVQLPDDDSTDNVVAVSIEEGRTYYWWVESNDPSAGVTRGATWSFDTFVSAQTLRGDFNNDGLVGFADLAMLTADWLNDCSSADISPASAGDGTVDFGDFCVLAVNWLYDAARDITVVSNGSVSDSYGGTQLVWKSGTAQRQDADIGFGLALPYQYNPQAETMYPLVLYLHGAGARGSNIMSVLQRQTAREFALHAQTSGQYAAFVVAPQVPSGERYVDVPWAQGPYEQGEATYTDPMKLTDALLMFLVDPKNNSSLAALGLDADDIDTDRLYVVGDSMGAYGTWDIVGRHPGLFAAAISASGSGPKNRLAEILETPFWAIHGIADSTVPNALPSGSDPDGAGSLGMLALLDPSFDNTASTNTIKLDDCQVSNDDPTATDRLIYTQFPSGYAHATVATEWTTLVPGVKEWLFSQQSTP